VGRHRRVTDPPRRGLRSVVVFVLVIGFSAGCGKNENKNVVPATAPSASARPKTPDRLAPGELAPGTIEVWGFVAPKQLTLERRFPDAAHFVGSVGPEQLANYIRTRVEAERVEIGAARTVFPSARIKGGPPGKTFRFEVLRDRTGTRLVVLDITPPPVVEGLSDEERWRRAGLTPQGEPLDRNKLQ